MPPERGFSPCFERLWIVKLIDSFVKSDRQSLGVVSDSERVIVTDALFSRSRLFEVVIIRCDKVARDHGIVHMINTRTEHHLIARDPEIVVLYLVEVTCSLMIGWSIVEL